MYQSLDISLVRKSSPKLIKDIEKKSCVAKINLDKSIARHRRMTEIVCSRKKFYPLKDVENKDF